MERKYICIDCDSYRVNTIKNNHTFKEIEKLYKSLYKMRRIVDKSE